MGEESGKGAQRAGLSVVIPVFNEEENLEELYAELSTTIESLRTPWECVFVDDGSTDATPHVLASLREEDSRVRVVRLQENKGLSAALSSGFRRCRGEIIVSMDGDLQFNPLDIPSLLGVLESESADVVCGRRASRKDGLSKRVLSSLAYVARRVILGDRTADAGCTFRAYRRRCVAGLALGPGHHRFLPHILRQRGCSVVELPVAHRRRRHGTSKFGWARLFRGCATLVSLRLGTIQSSR